MTNIAGFTAAIAILAYAVVEPASDSTHDALILGFAILGFALARIKFLTNGRPVVAASANLKHRVHFLLVAFCCGTALFGLSYWAGMRQIGGFDHSVLIDTPWRMLHGQTPCIDFPCTLPVGFYVGALYGFELFGPKWRSLVLINSLFSFIAFIWIVEVLRLLLNDSRQILVLALFCISATTLLVGYWWYNSVTSVVAVIYFLSAYAWLQRPDAKWLVASYALSLTILATLKPNVAGPLILGATLVLWTSKPHQTRAICVSIVAFASFNLLLYSQELSLERVISGYVEVSSRGFGLTQFMQDLGWTERIGSMTILFGISAPLLLIRNQRSLFSRSRILLLVGYLAGFLGFLLNGEIKFVDLPLMMYASVFWVRESEARRGQAMAPSLQLNQVVNAQMFLVLVLAFAALGMGTSRHRVKAIGYGAFFEYAKLDEVRDNEFFSGVHGSPAFLTALREVGDVLQDNPSRRVFFGPRMQWAYAAFGLPAPAKQPVWWHAGVSYSKDEELRYVIQWNSVKYDVLIFYKDDNSYLPIEFLTAVGQSYAVSRDRKELTRLTVLTRKSN